MPMNCLYHTMLVMWVCVYSNVSTAPMGIQPDLSFTTAAFILSYENLRKAFLNQTVKCIDSM